MRVPHEKLLTKVILFIYILLSLFCFVSFFAENNKFEAIKTFYGPLNYTDFFCSVLKQMPVFPLIPLIPSVLSEISLLVPGIRFLLIVLKIEEEAGGMTTAVLNVLFGQISMVFIRVVEKKPWPLSTGET